MSELSGPAGDGVGSDRPELDRGVVQRRRLGRGDAMLVLFAVLGAFCRPLTSTAAVAVLLPGLALLPVMVWRSPRRRPSGSWRSASAWVVLALLVLGWEITAMVWGNDRDHPTLSLLLDPVLATYPGRLLGWLGWLAVGRWLVTR